MSFDTILQSNHSLPIYKKGKVRDVYDLDEKLLIVSTDRISAFDIVLPNGIPKKGEALNRLSAYWFNKTKDIVENHILEIVDPRTILVKKTKNIEIEFIVRGYLYGSAWEKYKKNKPICGIKLPMGLRKAEKLNEPLLTPTTKSETGHDVEMTFNEVKDKVGDYFASKIQDISFKIYERTLRKAEENGIIMADTKMEFGMIDEELFIIDELATPDSSRFWSLKKYEIGKNQESFDKQYVRDYLLKIGWNKQPPAPKLPKNVVLETSKKYVEAYERLTGNKF